MKNAAPTNPRARRREAESMLSDPLPRRSRRRPRPRRSAPLRPQRFSTRGARLVGVSDAARVDTGAAMRHELAAMRGPALISPRPDAILAV
jgi:hypothetical protein